MEQQNVLEQILEGSMKPTHLPLETLRKITEDFSVDRLIGEGGFGKVYKGVVGNKNVAVKRIRSSMTINEKLFRREVGNQMDVNHENVVRFLGLCSHTVETLMKNPEAQGRYIFAEIRERLLCFEFVSNGSLDKYITDELRGLEWGTRYQIIKGICAGLHYLQTKKNILHLDLKPANILLDNQMVPKITDFGLSRPIEISQNMTTHYFSPGYGAPENLSGHDTMSVKSDMYSLGAIIIELVTGQKGIPDNTNNVLRRWRHSWNKTAKETPLEYHHQVIECTEIGKLCQNFDPHTRPSISQVMNKFVEMESTKINPIHWEDDMLGVEPLELRFGFNKEQILSCSVELSNDTDVYIAFNIETTSPLPYSIEPNKDIVKPRSKFSVDIKLPFASIQDYKAALQYSSSNQRYSKELIVQSLKVNEGLTTKDINKNMFDKHTEGHHVDEIHLVVVSEESYSEEKAFLEKNNSIQPSLLLEKMSSNVAMIPLDLIKNITDEFSEKNRLGKGGYGEVYKGVLNGQEIAVKKLFPVHGLDEEAFTNELRNLMKVQHKNILRLIGYSYEISHRHIHHDGQFVFSKVIDRALCFEFMDKGSLSQHLSAESCIHDWPTTFKIIKGTCEGIDYLHTGRGENNSIYHLDLKPDNILMDKNMVPKIGDFGLSRLFNDSATHQTTTAKGTIGFMPPEFTSNGIVTRKNDVFSLGVIIFHLMAGEKGYDDYCDLCVRRELLENREQFIGGVQEYWKKTMQRTVGYTLTGTDLLGVRACLQMAMRCVDDDRDKRPSTREIISDLSKLSDQIEKMPTIVQTSTRSNMSGPVAAHAAGRGNLDVVIVYAFDCTNSTPAREKVGDVFSLVEKKLANFMDSRLGHVYVMSTTPNTYKCDINFVDQSKKGESSATRSAVCMKNMASGLPEAHKLMGDNGERNGIILLFSDGLINTGDFFDGAEDFISKVPVHTFTLGGDAYNHGLRTIASNSPDGSFSPVLLTDMPSLSVPFLRQLDSLLDGTTRDHSKHPSAYSGSWPLDVVIVCAFYCTNSSLAWYTVGDVYAMVKGMLLTNSESSIGFTYVTLRPNTCTSDMNLVSCTMTGYEKSSAWRRTTCVKNMACGLLEAHKLISYRGHWNSLILLFSDGLINKGDFFDGAEDYISKVPVHTFTLGGDAYNHGLRSMAMNSPGGKFHDTQVPDKPILSETFSQLLDSIIGDAMKTSYS